jgi:hypothetical protein
MALLLQQSRFSFRSTTTAGVIFTFDVVVSQTGDSFVDKITGPYGPVSFSGTGIPASVQADIQQAILQAEGIAMSTSAFSGQATFTNATSQVITFNTPMLNSDYRVYLDAPDFIIARVVSKSTTSFTISTSITYTGVIGFDVFV